MSALIIEQQPIEHDEDCEEWCVHPIVLDVKVGEKVIEHLVWCPKTKCFVTLDADDDRRPWTRMAPQEHQAKLERYGIDIEEFFNGQRQWVELLTHESGVAS